jgi:hypothetical protein
MTLNGIDNSLFKEGMSSLFLSKNQMTIIAFLVMYNIFLSKLFNDGCLKNTIDNISNYFNLKPLLEQICINFNSDVYCATYFEFNPLSSKVWYSILGCIIYLITFVLYYKIITKNMKNVLMFFIVFILFISIILLINSSNVIKDSYFNVSSYLYAMIAYMFLFSIGTIMIYVMSYDDKVNATFKQILTYSLFILFGIFFLFSLINWVIQFFDTFSTKSDGTTSVVGIILNFAIIITIMAILFKMISYSDYYNESPLLQVIIGSVFYIPCFLISVINRVTGYYKETKIPKVEGFHVNLTDIILLVMIIVLYILYFYLPTIYTNYSSQGGKMLIQEPIYLNNTKVLINHSSLVKIEKSYSYGLSCWVFIDGGSSVNSANDKLCSILNYGNKPNLKYKGKNNTFVITYDDNKDDVDNKYNLDEFGNIIIYETTELLLQKWNNIIFNYNSGIIDIFINGELKQSYEGKIPYMTNDNIVSGENDGIHGGICNVVYYNNALTMDKISNIYNSVKMLNPPILLNYYDMLYLSSLKIENISERIGVN